MQFYEEAWRAIIQPPQLKGKNHYYGPKQQTIDHHLIIREDITILNRNSKKLKGFFFHPANHYPTETILYLHGNGGTKLEALPLVNLIVKYHTNLAAFDLLGCGHSDSEYLTYGVNEVHDIREIVIYLINNYRTQKIILWGRSMGAQCSIIYAEMYPDQITGMILDSPFRNLSAIIDRIAENQVSVPKIILKPALYFIKRKAAKEANQQIFETDYLEVFKKIVNNIPILFVYSHFDKIVLTEEVLQFYNCYEGPKGLCQIFQTHDEDRPDKLFIECMAWIIRTKKNNTSSKYKKIPPSNHNTQKSDSLCC